jgi:hypothetical protein
MPSRYEQLQQRGDEARRRVLERLSQPVTTPTVASSGRLSRYEQLQQMRLTQPMQQPATTQTMKEAARQAAPERFAPELQRVQDFTRPQFIDKFPRTEVKAESKTETKPAKKGLAAQAGAGKFTETMFAMAGDALDNLTFGLTDKLTDRIERYVRGDRERTPQEEQAAQLFGMVGYLGAGAGAYRAARGLTRQVTKQLPKLADDAAAKVLARTNASPITAATTRMAAQSAGRAAGHALTGATAGAIFQAPFEATEAAFGKNNQTIGQRLGDIAESAALGAILDPIAESYIGAVGNMLRRTTRAFEPTRARVVKRPSLDQVLTEIKPIVQERMTPPLENPRELARWIQQNSGIPDLSLNEIRKLSYEGMRQLAEDIRRNMNIYDTSIAVARERGYDLEKLLAGPRRVSPEALQRGRETLRMREIAGVPLVRSQDPTWAERASRMSRAEQLAQRSEVQPAQAAQPMTAARPRQLEELQPARTVDDDVPFADEIEPPELDEIAPRVRDRVNAFADRLIESARAELAASRNRLSSNPVDIYAQYAKIGAGYMLKGAVRLADFTEAMVRDFGEQIRPYVREIYRRAKDQYKVIQKQIESEELGLTGFEGQKLKDLSTINLNTADVYRNFKTVFGPHYESVKRAILDPFDAAKGAYAEEQKRLTDALYNDIVKGLGIKKGSKESALVQQFGEGRITLDELQKAAPDKWQNIVQANEWFRRQYDDLINRVNAVLARIYPNRPEKLVPYRRDYYRHFQELRGWSGLKNLFDTTATQISPSLAGISPFTQPKTKWASFKQRRGLGEFKDDAVGGFLDYIPAASYAIHIDPHISVFRNLAKRLAEDTEQTKNLNNFIAFLHNFANDLAGKTSEFDRFVAGLGGRKALQWLTWANNRVKANVILGNVRSTLSQLANIPNGIAYGGIDAPAGALRTIQSVFQPNEAMQRSKFLKERYIEGTFRRFDQKWWEQPRRFAEFMMEASDRIGTSFVWNTAYAKAIRQGVADPVKFADEQTRRLVGGRGVGEQPLMIKSKVFNLVAPFQLEVNNLWRVMKDFVDEKRFGALVTLFVSNWLLNQAFERVTGSGVVLDPIDAIYEAATVEDASVLQRAGRIAGEVLSNVPLGQTATLLYPQYGKNVNGMELPTRKELFGDNDPTRFGSGLLVAGAITDPLFKFVLPFGGNQLKKTISGVDALVRGGSYTENVLTTGLRIEEPKLRFPVESTPQNTLRAALFGPYATSEGQEYARENRRPLSERQTRVYQNIDDPQTFYRTLMEQRRRETELKKLREQQLKGLR